MRHPKQSGFGFVERFRHVDQMFNGAAEEIRESVPRKDASDDDILDALAALWTAQRIYTGIALRLGNPPEQDEYGLRMQMLA
jgi:predicted RNase H-like nuclease